LIRIKVRRGTGVVRGKRLGAIEAKRSAMNPMLTVPIDKLALIIEKAREFDAVVEVDDPGSASNAVDDREISVLEDTADNPTEYELRAALSGLNDDEVAEVLALVWIGRGDFDKEGWDEAVSSARATRNNRAVDYLIGTPMLGDLLEEGLAELGVAVPLPEEEEAV
jgi:hypothetical protein